METSTITYSVSSCSDSLLEASKDFVIKLVAEENGAATMRRIRLYRIVDNTGRISYDQLVRLAGSKIRFAHRSDVRLSYLDVDEDCVMVDSSEELVDAIEQFADQQVLRLFVGEVTPAMKQVYLSSGTDAFGKHESFKKLFETGEMEQILERQIERVLEKRFRLLEQKRREQEHGLVGHDPPNFQHQYGGMFRDSHQHHQSNHHQAQGRKQHHPNHHLSQLKTPRQKPYSDPNAQDGWYDSPIKVDDVSADSLGGETLGEEDFLPNEDSSRNAPRIRLPWEGPDDDLRPLKPSSDRKPPRENHHSYKRRNSLGGNNMRPSHNVQDEYDLSLMNNRSLLNHHRISLARRNGLESPVAETKRINISRDPVQTLNKTNLKNYGSGTNRRIRGLDDLDDLRDEDDFRPEDPDPEDEMDDDDDTIDTYGEEEYDSRRPSRVPPPPTRQGKDETRYLQDWETNTLDSDGELSLLLSDTDFMSTRDRDDITSRGPATVASSQLSTATSEHYSQTRDENQEERRDEPEEERQDENKRQGAEPPAASSSANQSLLSPKKLQQPQSPKQYIQQTPPQQQIKTPPQSPSTPTSTNVSKRMTPTTPKSNMKPPVPSRSNFNNIPRPTPPAAKKNKLLGILYN